MKESRQRKMATLIAQQQSMTMEELCHEFNVSMNTVRADISALIKTGEVKKIYGGVQATNIKNVPLFETRCTQCTEEKKRIASTAAAYINDGDIIYADAGTTVMHMLDFLDPQKHITLVTNNLYLIWRVPDMLNIRLIVLPGTMDRRTNALLDAGTCEFLSRYRMGKAFLGTTGISENGWLSVSSMSEYEVKRMAIHQSRNCYLLADSTKYGKTNLMAYAEIKEMAAVIADKKMPNTFQDYCSINHVKLDLV